MGCYTARIELHTPSERAYQALDREMFAAGFSQAHKLDFPGPRGLDPAEYLREKNEDMDGAFEAARDAAGRLGVAFTVLVCESSTQKWIGLRVSTPA